MRPARRWAASCGRATPVRTPPPTRSRWPEQALGQIPVEHIQGIELLLRVDSAGAAHELLGLGAGGADPLLGRL